MGVTIWLAGSLVDDLVEANVADAGCCVTEHADLRVYQGQVLRRVGRNWKPQSTKGYQSIVVELEE